MSLDVYLHRPSLKSYFEVIQRVARYPEEAASIQDAFKRIEALAAEALDACPEEVDVAYSRNITHNLNVMADAAGIYQALWRPGEIGVRKAKELIPLLEKGLAKLVKDPPKYRLLNPENGWGELRRLGGLRALLLGRLPRAPRVGCPRFEVNDGRRD